jgi:hypothetical protein
MDMNEKEALKEIVATQPGDSGQYCVAVSEKLDFASEVKQQFSEVRQQISELTQQSVSTIATDSQHAEYADVAS